MKKDFKHWHSKKVRRDSIPERPFFHEGEIWCCHLGANIGSEQDGVGDDFLRPIIILRKFNDEVFWGVPLTRTRKESPYYFAFAFGGEISVAIFSQTRLIRCPSLKLSCWRCSANRSLGNTKTAQRFDSLSRLHIYLRLATESGRSHLYDHHMPNNIKVKQHVDNINMCLVCE